MKDWAGYPEKGTVSAWLVMWHEVENIFVVAETHHVTAKRRAINEMRRLGYKNVPVREFASSPDGWVDSLETWAVLRGRGTFETLDDAIEQAIAISSRWG